MMDDNANSPRHHDAESGLYHYRARAYSADVGRFMQQDPAGMVDGPNLYAYVGNNPVNRVDPTGMRWSWLFRLWIRWNTQIEHIRSYHRIKQYSEKYYESVEQAENPYYGMGYWDAAAEVAWKDFEDGVDDWFEWAQQSGGGGAGQVLLMTVVWHVSGHNWPQMGPQHK